MLGAKAGLRVVQRQTIRVLFQAALAAQQRHLPVVGQARLNPSLACFMGKAARVVAAQALRQPLLAVLEAEKRLAQCPRLWRLQIHPA